MPLGHQRNIPVTKPQEEYNPYASQQNETIEWEKVDCCVFAGGCYDNLAALYICWQNLRNSCDYVLVWPDRADADLLKEYKTIVVFGEPSYDWFEHAFCHVKNCYIVLKVDQRDQTDDAESRFKNEDRNNMLGAAHCAWSFFNDSTDIKDLLLNHMAKCGQYYDSPVDVPNNIGLLGLVLPYHCNGNMKLEASKSSRARKERCSSKNNATDSDSAASSNLDDEDDDCTGSDTENDIFLTYLEDIHALCDKKPLKELQKEADERGVHVNVILKEREKVEKQLLKYLDVNNAPAGCGSDLQRQIFDEAKYRADRFTYSNKALNCLNFKR